MRIDKNLAAAIYEVKLAKAVAKRDKAKRLARRKRKGNRYISTKGSY